MALFGTDGVRGQAGSYMDPFMVVKLAMAAGIYYQRSSRTKKIMVGKDTRRSGYMIENALVSGFTAVGYNVVQIGPMPTPAVAFLTESMRCDGGIMISASHNRFDDNGIKFFDHNGHKLPLEAEKEIEAIYHNQALLDEHIQVGKNIGSSKRIDDVIGRYIVKIKDSFPNSLDLSGKRIVLDTANGAAYKVGPTIFQELGADVIVINSEPNGSNINEDCGALHPNNLGKFVVKYRADIGFAMDGDADRLVVVDENGEAIDGDKLLGALAIHLKQQNKLDNDGCVATKMSNGALDDCLKEHGITLYRSDVGDKYVAEVMKKEKLVFGGEQSGHVIFSKYAKTGDGLVSALQTMAYVIESGKKASEALDPFTLYPQMQTALMIAKKIPFNEYKGLDALLKEVEMQGMRHLIRYSGTENKLRVLIEGSDKKILSTYFNKVVELLKKSNA
jgi:phosphoglucosamine mutase